MSPKQISFVPGVSEITRINSVRLYIICNLEKTSHIETKIRLPFRVFNAQYIVERIERAEKKC